MVLVEPCCPLAAGHEGADPHTRIPAVDASVEHFQIERIGPPALTIMAPAVALYLNAGFGHARPNSLHLNTGMQAAATNFVVLKSWTVRWPNCEHSEGTDVGWWVVQDLSATKLMEVGREHHGDIRPAIKYNSPVITYNEMLYQILEVIDNTGG